MKKVIIILFLGVIVSYSCKNKKKEIDKSKIPVAVDIIIAEQHEFPNTIEVNGSVLSQEMIELRPEISGRLVYLNISDGAKVTEGTLLARINDNDLQAQMEQQRVQLSIAKNNENRLKQLLKINGVNQMDYDNALGQLNTVEATIKVLNAQIEKTVIKAPFNGVLGLRMVSLGAYVTPQSIISTLQQTDKVKIDFTLPESYLSLISIGSLVNVTQSSADKSYEAKVIAVEPQINTDTRNIKVRATLTQGSLKPGAFVKVMLNQNAKGVIVPTNAIIPDAMSNQVIIIKKGKPKFQNVETGIRTADVVEITKGLNAGDSVVVSGILFIRNNSNIKVKKIKSINNL